MTEFLCNLYAWTAEAMPSFWLGTRGVCHLLVFLLVVGYQAPTTKHRTVVGVVAGVFSGANAAEAYRVASNFNSFTVIVQPPLTVVMLCVLFFVLYARGNMARMLPSHKADMFR